MPRSTADLVDQAALNLVPEGSVMRVDVVGGWAERVRENVNSLLDVWAIEPDRSVDKPRPVGRVLRQFYECLVGGERRQAEAALDELRFRGLLSSANLRFLRVELLSSLGNPAELLDDPLLRDISLLARPSAVTESLAEAVNAILIEPAISAGVSDLQSVAERIDAGWPGLVTQMYQVKTPATARCFALGQLLLDRPERDQLREIAVRYPNDVVAAKVLASTASGPPVATEVPTNPLSLYSEGNYQAALDAVAAKAPDRSGASVALAAAVNLRDPTSAARVLAMVDQLDQAVRAELLGSVVERAFYENLQALTAGEQVPTGWLDWLNGDWPDRPDLLDEWSSDWTREPVEVAAIADELAGSLIDALSDSRRPRVRNGLPVFVEWLISSISPSSVGLAVTTFDIMLSSDPGRSERQAALSLLDAILDIGCTAEEYRELIAAIVRELSAIGPRDSQWLAQAIDLVFISACPNPVERTALISNAAGLAGTWADRLDKRDALVLGMVFRDAGADVALPEEVAPHAEESAPLDSVGVYSLMESAIRVFSTWVVKQWPDVKVRSSSAAVNSSVLAALVKGVDVMLVQTSHSKHSATGAINMAMDDPRRLVLVHGRGATSLMRALLEWIQAA